MTDHAIKTLIKVNYSHRLLQGRSTPCSKLPNIFCLWFSGCEISFWHSRPKYISLKEQKLFIPQNYTLDLQSYVEDESNDMADTVHAPRINVSSKLAELTSSILTDWAVMKKIRLDEQCISDPVLLEYNLIQIIADKSSFMLM